MKKGLSTTKAVLPVAAVMTLSVAALPFGYYYISRNHIAATADLQSDCDDSAISPDNMLPVASPLKTNDAPEPEPAIDETEEVKTDADVEDEITYIELELRDPNPHVCSRAEAYDLIASGRTRYAENHNRPNLIDTQKYISMYFGEEAADGTDSNDWERKSYLYHMMLNSVDHIQTAQGTVIDGIAINEPCTIDFQTDIRRQCSHEVITVNGKPVQEFFVSDEVKYRVDLNTKTYMESRKEMQEDMLLSDNDRVLILDDGEYLVINRPDKSNLNASHSFCLYPQSYAMSRLDDFDTWNISDVTSLLDRACAVIEGTYRECPFKMYVDINTGILLKYEVYDENNVKTAYIETTSITLNEDIEVKQFDSAGYTPEYQEPVYRP